MHGPKIAARRGDERMRASYAHARCECGGKVQNLDLFDIFECETQSGFCEGYLRLKQRVLHVADHVSGSNGTCQHRITPRSRSSAECSAVALIVEIYRMQQS